MGKYHFTDENNIFVAVKNGRRIPYYCALESIAYGGVDLESGSDPYVFDFFIPKKKAFHAPELIYAEQTPPGFAEQIVKMIQENEKHYLEGLKKALLLAPQYGCRPDAKRDAFIKDIEKRLESL